MFIGLLIATITISYIIYLYNKIITLIESADKSKNDIDVQLDRRFKVFEGLIKVVKNVMNYESTVLRDIVELRSQATNAKIRRNQAEQINAEDQISKIANNINLIFEQYPQLAALDNAKQLQEEIVSTENKLSFTKHAYNDSVEKLNSIRKSFIGSLVVSFFSNKLNTPFEYWQISSERRNEMEEYHVEI